MDTNKKRVLDIFNVLNHINKKDKDFINTLTEEELKAFQPYVVMRWLSGTASARQIFFLNTLVNQFVFNIPDHKVLLYYLMTICTSGKNQRYTWSSSASKKNKTLPNVISVIRDYYKYSSSEARDVLPLLSHEDILSHAACLGRQPDEIAKIKKELKEVIR